MSTKTAVGAALLMAYLIGPGGAQRSGTTTLAVQVNPEARLDPQEVALNFRVSADGASDVTTQTTIVAAWVRTLPGQQIRVTASLNAFNGPDGPVPPTQLNWVGSTTQATAGAQAATCSSGTFQTGTRQDLVLGWQRSGTLTCAVTFALAAPRSLSPGLYSGTMNLALGTR
jgi:hypothetical protein